MECLGCNLFDPMQGFSMVSSVPSVSVVPTVLGVPRGSRAYGVAQGADASRVPSVSDVVWVSWVSFLLVKRAIGG